MDYSLPVKHIGALVSRTLVNAGKAQHHSTCAFDDTFAPPEEANRLTHSSPLRASLFPSFADDPVTRSNFMTSPRGA